MAEVDADAGAAAAAGDGRWRHTGIGDLGQGLSLGQGRIDPSGEAAEWPRSTAELAAGAASEGSTRHPAARWTEDGAGGRGGGLSQSSARGAVASFGC